MTTLEDVRKAVEHVREVQGDPEAAHEAEDLLFREVLLAIATGQCEDPKACAAEALKTRRLGFRRWCA